MLIVAEEADGELAGLSGRWAWGEASTAAPGATASDEAVTSPPVIKASNAALVVALGCAPGLRVDLQWLDGATAASETAWASEPTMPSHAAIGGSSTQARLIAQAGDGLWRCAPWPVADPLFDLEPPPPGAGVLVAGGAERRREDLRATLAGQGVPVVAREGLVLGDVHAASVVILPSAPESPLPARALAVLATGRLLVTARSQPTFGLLPGIDYLAPATNGEAARLAGAALRFPRAFASLRAFGRLAASPHRASLVYGRLLADVSLEEEATALRRSRALRG